MKNPHAMPAVILLTSLLNAAPAGAVAVTLNSLSEQILGATGPAVYGTSDWEITNNTGTTWTDFHVWDAEPIGGWNASSLSSGQGTISYGLSADSAHYQFNIVDLSIPDGGVFSFSFTETCGIAEICGLGGVILRGYPTIDSGVNHGVFEPSTLALLGVGLVALGVRRSRSVGQPALPGGSHVTAVAQV